MGEFHRVFPRFLQGGRRSRARRVQHTLETYGIVTSGMLISLGDFLDSSYIVPGSNGRILQRYQSQTMYR